MHQLGGPGKRGDAQGILGFAGREFAGRPARLHTCVGATEGGQTGNDRSTSSSTKFISRELKKMLEWSK